MFSRMRTNTMPVSKNIWMSGFVGRFTSLNFNKEGKANETG